MADVAPREGRWTERDLLDLLAARHRKSHGNGPRYVFAEHVRNEGGFGSYLDLETRQQTSRQTTLRTADAMAVDLWPSSGNVIHGFEVKVSRSDWLTELRDPAKSAAFMRYVDHWWLVVPDSDVVRGDLPESWGLMVAGRSGLRVVRQAPRLDPEPMPRGLHASLARAVAKTAVRGMAPLGSGL